MASKHGARSRLFLAMAIVMAAGSAHAATRIAVNDSTLSSLAGTRVEAMAAALNLEDASTLEAVRSAPTVHGTQTVRLAQLWHGVPVLGAGVTVEADASQRVQAQRGVVFGGIANDLPRAKPRLDAATASRLWRRQGGVGQDAEDIPAKLYVYIDESGKAVWAYQLAYAVHGERPSQPSALMDADTGKVLSQWDGLKHAQAEADGPGGNRKTGAYTYGQGSRPPLRATTDPNDAAYCRLETDKVVTYDLAHATSPARAKVWRFLCPTSQGDAINSAYGPINDAHHFGGVVFDMYQSYFQRSPLQQKLKLMVHYGRNYENAFWQNGTMSFGDGASTFYPLVSLDVVAHEVSHGFTEQNSDLFYYGQSGGMNEAFSDMAGEAAEWFDQGANDFLVGAQIFKAKNGALRYMCEPRRDGNSIDHVNQYYSGLDVHYSSGVYNKAFCQLAKTEGWDTGKAFKAFGRANMLYWRDNETFHGGACGVERAAHDLGLSDSDVAEAFATVGVQCNP